MTKRRFMVTGLTLMGLALALIIVTAHFFNTVDVVTRPVRLVISAPEGQRFSGSYVADGVTNSVSALAPASISLQARDVAFEFAREAGDGEFRVELFVGELCRTSTTSHKQHGVRGQLRWATDSETYWAEAY